MISLVIRCCSIYGSVTHKWWVYHRLNSFKLTGMVYSNRSSLIILVNDAKYIHFSPIFSTSQALSHLDFHKFNRILLFSLQILVKSFVNNLIIDISYNVNKFLYNIDKKKIIDDLFMLKCHILKQLPNCRVIVSKPTVRIDHGKTNLTLRNVNKHLETLNLECIENGNISVQHLGRKGLHLNSKGKGRLALNFLNQIRKF